MRLRLVLLIGAMVFVLGVVSFGVFVFLEMNRSVDDMLENLVIRPVNVAGLADGTYLGEFGQRPVMASVRVSVADGHLDDITILQHEHGRGYDGEQVVERILGQQSLEVDTVSGATISSLVILKAVEVALLSGPVGR